MNYKSKKPKRARIYRRKDRKARSLQNYSYGKQIADEIIQRNIFKKEKFLILNT